MTLSQQDSRSERRSFHSQYVRSQGDPALDSGQLSLGEPTLGADEHRVDTGRERRRRRGRRSHNSGVLAASANGDDIENLWQPEAPGLHRRLAGDSAQSLDLTTCARSASQRTTLCAHSMNPIDVAPISVSFCTIHSGRSPFGIAVITVAGRGAGSKIGSDVDRHGTGRQPRRRPSPRRRRRP